MGTAVRAMVFAQKLRRRASPAASAAAATGIAAAAAAAAAAGAGAGGLDRNAGGRGGGAATARRRAVGAFARGCLQPLPHAGFTHEGGAGGMGKENQVGRARAAATEHAPLHLSALTPLRERPPADRRMRTRAHRPLHLRIADASSLSPPLSALCAALAPTSKRSPCSTATGKRTAARRRARRRRRSRRT